MNEHVAISKIKSAINVLTVARNDFDKLPEKKRRTMVGNSSFDAAIRGLEIALAEINGEPWPAAPIKEVDPSIDEVLDA